MSGDFARRLLRWYDHHGRKDLPWQRPLADGSRDAYRVWVSEVMLQQTQVATVIGYFERFVAALPDLPALAAASEDEVLALWSGLGYYRRARFLQRAARLCMERHGGALPRDFDALVALPGIGRSTAGAILAQAHGERHAILDGNVKRVLARYHGIEGFPGDSAVERELWTLAERHTPQHRLADYTQAIMDLGATLCTRSRPDCAHCPLAADCIAHRDGRTAELPARKPGKTQPLREIAMLVLRDVHGRVLLERRGPEGVWPGLWSLPEAADAAAARRLAGRFAHSAEAEPLPAFTHVFTHFRLRVAPLLFDHATSRSAVADAPERRWLAIAEAEALGLPAPVRQLLRRIKDGARRDPAE